MDLGSIFLILGLFVLVGLYIARPLIEQRSPALTKEEHQLSSLLAERDRLLNALQELDFDYTLGKIPEADYPAQRAGLLQRGAEVLKELDVHQAGGAVGGDVEQRIEAAIAARRADAARSPVLVAGNGGASRIKSAAAAVGQDDDLEAIIASRRRGRQGKSAGFCPQCGGTVQKIDRFCPKCGAKLA